MLAGGFTGRSALVSNKSTAFAKAIFFAPGMPLVKELVSLDDLFLHFPRDDVSNDALGELLGESVVPH